MLIGTKSLIWRFLAGSACCGENRCSIGSVFTLFPFLLEYSSSLDDPCCVRWDFSFRYVASIGADDNFTGLCRVAFVCEKVTCPCAAMLFKYSRFPFIGCMFPGGTFNSYFSVKT